MDNSKQVETVKQVLDLEVYVSNTSQRLSALKSEQFGLAPKAPVKTTIKRSYPKIESQRKVNWAIAIILSLFFVPLGFIYYFSVKKAKERDVERIRNSAEYKARCAKLNAEYDRQQAAADRKYQAEKAAYDSRLLPEYKAALNAWNVAQKQKISQTERDLANAQNQLSEIYRTTKVVPLQYRNINALKYIYSMISTSDYDVKQAIDHYDRYKQRKLDEAKIREQRRQTEEMAAARASYQYSETEFQPSSGGGGFLSHAVNAALDSNRPKKESKDLMGSAGCMYGKRKDGFTVYCDIRCPLWRHCSRGAGR